MGKSYNANFKVSVKETAVPLVKKVKKTSLKSARRAMQATLAPTRVSSRVKRMPMSAREALANEEQAALLDVDMVELTDQDDLDDEDYLQNVPGRPAQPRMMFNTVYGPAAWNPITKEHEIQCFEPICIAPSRLIRMNNKWTEQDSKPNLKGKPRRPPVCHKVPWAALEIVLINNERIAQREYSIAFRTAVCWFDGNVQAGHNACNSAGVKITAQTVIEKVKREAQAVIDAVMLRYSGSVWQ